MKFFEFVEQDYQYIVQKCMLNEDYAELLMYKIKGYSIVKIADLMHISESKVSVMTDKLKKKIKKII